MKTSFTFIFALGIFFTSCQTPKKNDLLVDYADNHIGVIDKKGNNCVIGPKLPFGSISPSPQSRKGGMDGYNPKEPIRGFGQLHVSGTGWGSYGHFLVSPLTGKIDVGLESHDSPQSEEVARPYYYSVNLDRYGIKSEIAPSHYSTIYRFTYPENECASLILDATQALATDIVPEMNGRVNKSSVMIDPETQTIKMYINYKGGWPNGYYSLYCVAKFNRKADECGVWSGNNIKNNVYEIEKDSVNSMSNKDHIGAFLTFNKQDTNEVLMKLSISFNSFENAEALLDSEIPDWNFEKVKNDARLAWEDKFNAIRIETDSIEVKKIFYSSMFRFYTMLADRSLDNPSGETDKPYWDDNYAIWDTFRSAYPLMLLTDEESYRSNINFFIERFEKNGTVYDGFIAGRDRKGEQGGNDVDCILSEACVKDVKGIVWEDVYRLMKYNADKRRIGYFKPRGTTGDGYLKYKELGWMPENPMSNSQTLEFSYNDYCVALVADKLGYKQDAAYYADRSRRWINLWNAELADEESGYKGFIDARREDGSFAYIPTRKYGGSWDTPFYEADTWTYSYYMPHDIEKTIELMGGKETFVDRLNYGFENNRIRYTNEPAFLTTRSFTHAGRPDLSSKWTHHIMRKGYDLTGFPENDDTGSMSSWYIFCSTGLFPNAGQDYYYLSAPLVNRAVYTISGGRQIIITANASPKNIYVKSCKVNGEIWNDPVIKHEVISNGATIEFELTDKPTDWGTNWKFVPSI